MTDPEAPGTDLLPTTQQAFALLKSIAMRCHCEPEFPECHHCVAFRELESAVLAEREQARAQATLYALEDAILVADGERISGHVAECSCDVCDTADTVIRRLRALMVEKGLAALASPSVPQQQEKNG